jgi:hypothetical protein
VKSLKTVFRRDVTADEEAKQGMDFGTVGRGPLAVYFVAGLWTYLSYYVILYPVHFLVLGALGRRAVPLKDIAACRALFVVGNVVFMLDVNRYLSRYGGAQGTYGSGLGFKQEAADLWPRARTPGSWSKKTGCCRWIIGSGRSRRSWICRSWPCCRDTVKLGNEFTCAHRG